MTRSRRRGPIFVVGRRPALEAVRSKRAGRVLISTAARSTPALREVVEAAGSAGVPVETVPPERIDSVAAGEHHQGVAARVSLPPPLDEAALASRAWSEEAVVVLLDGVTDPHNLGAVARTAEAAGAEALVLRRRRGATVGPAAVRASAGALLHLPVAEVANLTRAIGRLHDGGFWVVGLDTDGSGTIDSPRPAGRLALVLGSEGEGLSRLVARACDEVLSIPLHGAVRSLNVSVAAGVGLFAYAVRGNEKKRT